MYYLGSAKQASDYQVTTAYLINHIQKTFDLPEGIRDTLRNEELVDTNKWKPELEVSTNTDDDNRAVENKMFELEYKVKYTKWLNNTEIYKANLIKAMPSYGNTAAKECKIKLRVEATILRL